MTIRDHLGPENAALHDELDRLLAARAVALEEAAHYADEIWEPMETLLPFADKSANEAAHTGQWEAAERIASGIRALATTDSTEALERVIRAHVEKALAGNDIRVQRRRWFVETGVCDGFGIGRWESTTESVEVHSEQAANTLRDEWLASGKLKKTHWNELRPQSNYGLFRIRSVWEDIAADEVLREMGGRGNG